MLILSTNWVNVYCQNLKIKDNGKSITIEQTKDHMFRVGNLIMDETNFELYAKFCLSRVDTVSARGWVESSFGLPDESKIKYFVSTQAQSDFNNDLQLKAIGKFEKFGITYYIVHKQPSELDFMSWWLKGRNK